MTGIPIRPALALAALLVLGGTVGRAQSRPAPTRTEVAPGVHLFQTAPYGDVGLDGNSVAIVGTDGVLVFDSNGTPAAATAVIAEIRKLTDKPVRFLVNSHWHWDHWYGAEAYRAAFPDVKVITHEASRRLMAGPAIAFNQPGLDSQLPGHIREVEAELERVRGSAGAETARLEAHVALDRFFLEQKRTFKPTLADLTFTDSLTVWLGDREIRVLHHDRAITPGDAYLFLPDGKVLITGDLLINPITFALFSYPAGWIATLEALDRLDASVIVPGHGSALRDERLLHATLALLRREAELGRAAKARGVTAPDAVKAILADAEVIRLKETITGGDARRDQAFSLYLVDWFVRRLWQELDGRIDDSIPATP